MSHGSNLGRSVFVAAAAAGVAGLLTYTPPSTDLKATGRPAPRSRPIVTGPFTATPSSVPPIPVVTPSTTPAPVVSTPVRVATVPPVTPPSPPPPPPPPPAPEAPPAVPYVPPAYVPPAYVPPAYVPAPRSTAPAPEPEPDSEPEPEPDGPCAGYDELLTVLDDNELRAAISTVGCG